MRCIVSAVGCHSWWLSCSLSKPGASTSVNDVLLARAAQLDAAAREVLDTTALLTEGAPVSVLVAALENPEPRIEACVDAGLLTHDGETLVFRHELTCRVIDDAITPTRRARLHHRILAGLIDAPGVDPAVCAHHAELAGDPRAVLQYAPAAACRAAALGAHREAAAQYERALRFAGGAEAADRGKPARCLHGRAPRREPHHRRPRGECRRVVLVASRKRCARPELVALPSRRQCSSSRRSPMPLWQRPSPASLCSRRQVILPSWHGPTRRCVDTVQA